MTAYEELRVANIRFNAEKERLNKICITSKKAQELLNMFIIKFPDHPRFLNDAIAYYAKVYAFNNKQVLI